ncbi:MAG: cytochrome c biogenesis protein CcsA [Spirosomataceae bacterium]
MEKLIKVFLAITSTRAAGIYLLLFAIAIGTATFIENDFGTSSAQNLVFQSAWFTVLLLLFSLCILANIWRFRLIKQKKWASLCFHAAIVIILVGAAITRFWGTEGMMHIREGETMNQYLSSESYIKFQVQQNGKKYTFEEPVHFSSLGFNEFSNSYQVGKNLIEATLEQFIPNAKEKAVEDPNGIPMIKVVIAGSGGREEYYVKQGDRVNINGINFNFTEQPLSDAFNVSYKNEGGLSFLTNSEVSQTVMATQKNDNLPGGIEHPLILRSLYSVGGSNFVIGDFIAKGKVSIESAGNKIKNESINGLNLVVKVNGQTQNALVTGRKGEEGQPTILEFGDVSMAVSYGSAIETLPFSLLCKDFILERYAGTDNPSSYASEVKLIDTQDNVNKDVRIFMNNILDYKGYRFFQSSYDPDELGTYLSVNHDYWGTLITYLGYFLLTLGLILTFFDKKSRFSHLLLRLKEYQANVVAVFLLFSLTVASSSYAQELTSPISKEHAEAFGKLLVQDFNGRIKPMNTHSSEILRKVSRKTSLFNLGSDQVMLSMILFPNQWEKANIIQVPDQPDIKRLLNTNENMVSYVSFFNQAGNYILEEQVKKAQATMPKDQGTFEKSIIKLDEKVNIVNMIFSGNLLRIFPQKGDSTNTWLSIADVGHLHGTQNNNPEATTLFSDYINALNESTNSNNFNLADQALSKIIIYQRENGGALIPSEEKLKAELLLNKLDVFNRLRNYDGMLCLVLTITFLFITVRKVEKRAKITTIAFYAVLLGLIFHTIGLGLRWYISGRAPWSNGYESMIYIGWTTTLAGTLFSRKSLGGLAATTTLAATILLVASMSWLDPEITPLVPVLKSYWLTIHVSMEAGSYGFLLLGAVVSMLNLLLMIFLNPNNKTNIAKTIKELTIISEIILLSGLVMISIGTYLGGVWANESWGRYWGWDAKETWALVTILVYAFILHMRFIPKLQSIYAFNFASLFGFGTVIMTYLGVNYYLSGLHSYAAGDPVPIPPSVYYTVISLTTLSALAYYKYRKVMR